MTKEKYAALLRDAVLEPGCPVRILDTHSRHLGLAGRYAVVSSLEGCTSVVDGYVLIYLPEQDDAMQTYGIDPHDLVKVSWTTFVQHEIARLVGPGNNLHPQIMLNAYAQLTRRQWRITPNEPIRQQAAEWATKGFRDQFAFSGYMLPGEQQYVEVTE